MKKFMISVLLAVLSLCIAAGSAYAKTPLQEVSDKLIGVKYKYGGTTMKGFDCSGFTSYVFNQWGYKLSRSSKSQAVQGTKVAKADLREGDLVFFNTNGKNISHVGMYIGNNKFIHASSSKKNGGVRISDLKESYYVKRYVTARRVLSKADFKKITTDLDKLVKETPQVQPGDLVDIDDQDELDDEVEIDDQE